MLSLHLLQISLVYISSIGFVGPLWQPRRAENGGNLAVSANHLFAARAAVPHTPFWCCSQPTD